MQQFTRRQYGKSHFLFILIALVAIGSGILVQTSTRPPSNSPEFRKAILLNTVKDLGNVSFIDHNQEPFGVDRLKGKWSVIFFGFTNCPDICPTTLQTLSQVKNELQATGVWNNYQVLMVSVDPERDSPERLKKYVPFFDPDFIGLSAPLDYTTEFAKNVGILIRKGTVFENAGYDVDHGAALILVNPDAQYAGVLTAPHNKADISADLNSLADFAGGKSAVRPIDHASKSDSLLQDKNETAQTKSTKESVDSPALKIANAWIRPAPPTASSMAAYLDLHNDSDQDITIIEVSSPQFDEAMVHQTSIKDGIASMSHIDALVIPANSSISLTPMGTHLMLIDASQPMQIGDSATLLLTTEDNRTFPTQVKVIPAKD